MSSSRRRTRIATCRVGLRGRHLPTFVAFFVALLASLLLAAPAFAGITSPKGPFTWPLNAAGTAAAPVDWTGRGYPPTLVVHLHICDGAPVTATWDPNLHCDVDVTAFADRSGSVKFTAGNLNSRLVPFDGPGPSQLFDCVYPGERGAGFVNGSTKTPDGLPAWDNCQVRMASNAQFVTPDQSLVTVTLPKPRCAPKCPAQASGSGVSGSGGSGSRAAGSSGTGQSAGGSGSQASTSGKSGSGFLASTGAKIGGLIILGVALLGGGWLVVGASRRRRGGGQAATRGPARS